MNSPSESGIIWKWKSNANPWANVEPDTWEPYSDTDNSIIENAHQQNQKRVELDYFWIDFSKQLQVNKQDSNKQRPIRREIIHIPAKQIREHRFTLEQPKLDYKALNTSDPFRSFISNSGFDLSSSEKIHAELVEKAAHGIEIEGAKLDKTQEAQRIANELRGVKHKSIEEILECCVKLYTEDTFLYRLINKVMRQADMCKGMLLTQEDQEYGRTLGPYCGLLEKYLCDSPNQEDITVYRCATLTNEMVDDYKKNIGRLAWWDAFSSTTKNKHEALRFGNNTLFVIYIPRHQQRCTGVDISSLSKYSHEEEILLHPAIQVCIQKVEYDAQLKKYVINLEVSCRTHSDAKAEAGHQSFSYLL